ncbi:unknown [Prevotella sp. CAG:1185]|nr:unknown [Prevotella sp. CAG:1185]
MIFISIPFFIPKLITPCLLYKTMSIIYACANYHHFKTLRLKLKAMCNHCTSKSE